MKIVSVVGARPNLVKIAPILRTLEHRVVRSDGRVAPTESILVHTGQHYDETLSTSFFDDLRIPAPDHALAVGSGSHAVMTADIMRRFEPVLLEERPDVVLVVGDVNSTLACALTAAKLQVRVAHVEAGLRSFDRSMPEEINRVLTDALSDFLFTTEEDASGGIQEETTWLGVPCLTLRDNTERPATITAGTNTLVGSTPERIIACARAVLRNGKARGCRPPLWDGHAAERIVQTLADHL